MSNNYKPIKSMKEVPDQLRKLRREYIRYQQAELMYSLSQQKKNVSQRLRTVSAQPGGVNRLTSVTCDCDNERAAEKCALTPSLSTSGGADQR